jgi:hypothetical protein
MYEYIFKLHISNASNINDCGVLNELKNYSFKEIYPKFEYK